MEIVFVYCELCGFMLLATTGPIPKGPSRCDKCHEAFLKGEPIPKPPSPFLKPIDIPKYGEPE